MKSKSVNIDVNEYCNYLCDVLQFTVCYVLVRFSITSSL